MSRAQISTRTKYLICAAIAAIAGAFCLIGSSLYFVGGPYSIAWTFCVAAVCGMALSIVCLVTAPRKVPPPGHCRQCGYNLTGNVSGVCPECGTKIGTLRRPR